MLQISYLQEILTWQMQGMGDVLMRLFSSLTAQKYSIMKAQLLVYIYGYIADRLFKNQYIINQVI